MTIFEGSRFGGAQLSQAPKPYVTANELRKQREAEDAVSKFIKKMRSQPGTHGSRFNELTISKQRQLAAKYLSFVSTVSEYEARNFIDRKDLIGLNFMAERAVFQGNLSELEGLMEYIIEKVEGCKSSLGIQDDW